MTSKTSLIRLPDIYARTLAKALFGILIILALILTASASHADPMLDYKLSVGDVLEYDSLDDQELPRQLNIGAGGKIQVPVLGTIGVSGMTIDAATEKIRKEFIDRELLKSPSFTLSVSTYRPIYVIGDVKTPGAIPFHANITVEQAIGLAGGPPSIASTTESRIAVRAQLQGELYGTDSDITRQAVWIARLVAELDGRERIALSDLPAKAQRYVDNASIDELIAVENKILEADRTALNSQKTILTASIAETRDQLKLFDQLAENQKVIISSTKDLLGRADSLLKSGLKTAGNIADIQRQLTNDEGRMLQILADKGTAVIRSAALEQQLATLADGSKKDTLIALQDRNAALLLLIARRRALEEQLYLVTNWAAVEQKDAQQTMISYKIRSSEQSADHTVTATTQLSPGDVLIVSINRSPQENAVTSLP